MCRTPDNGRRACDRADVANSRYAAEHNDELPQGNNRHIHANERQRAELGKSVYQHESVELAVERYQQQHGYSADAAG